MLTLFAQTLILVFTMTNTTKTATATELNVSALADLVVHYGGRSEFPNAIPRELTGNHIRRCGAAGLFVAVTSKTLMLTDAGKERVLRSMLASLRMWEKRGFSTGSTEELYKSRAIAMAKAYTVLGGPDVHVFKF